MVLTAFANARPIGNAAESPALQSFNAAAQRHFSTSANGFSAIVKVVGVITDTARPNPLR